MPVLLKLTLAYDGTPFPVGRFQPDQPDGAGGGRSGLAANHRRDGPRHRRRPHRRRRSCARAKRRRLTETRLTQRQLHRGAQRASFLTTSRRDASRNARTDFHATYDAVGKRYRYSNSQRADAPSVFDRRLRLARSAAARRGSDAQGRASARRHARLRQLSIRRIRTRPHPDHFARASKSDRRAGERRTRRLAVDTSTSTGDGFLYNMVRTIAGTLVEVGVGKRDTKWLAEVLAARDRRRRPNRAPTGPVSRARRLLSMSISRRQSPDGDAIRAIAAAPRIKLSASAATGYTENSDFSGSRRHARAHFQPCNPQLSSLN